MHRITLCIVYIFCLCILLYKILAKRMVIYIIINEKISTKYGLGSCSFLVHYKMGHIPGIQSLITFEPVNRFEQNELFCKQLIEIH